MSEAEKFQQVIHGAASLFRQFGIRSLSMDDISRELGISKKTLYSYVDSKADLIEAIMVSTSEMVHAYMVHIEEQGLNAIDELLEISNVVHSFHDEMNPSMRFDMMKYYPEVFQSFRQRKHKATQEFVIRNLEKGISEGLYRSDIDVVLVANLYIRKMEDIEDPEFPDEEIPPYETIFKVMFENHIRGISNPEGIAYFEKQKIEYEKRRNS
jgi:AcrR family transcriptional regulator